MRYHIPVKPPNCILRKAKRILSYNPKTGSIKYKRRPAFNSRKRIGDEAGYQRPDGYIVINITAGGFRRFLYAHHVAWFLHYGEWPDSEIDHKRGNRADNRIKRLRKSKHKQNTRNRRYVGNNTGVTGVIWLEGKQKYRAQIKKNGKNIYLGIFDDIIAAKETRRAAEIKYFGKWRFRHN
jgi:hypothetical protein